MKSVLPGVTVKLLAEKLDASCDDTVSKNFGESHVTDITHDSRKARPGSLFAAVKGATVDGHRFIDDVMRRGCVGVISQNPRPADFSGAWITVSDARRSLAKAAALIYGEPSKKLDLIGITGTNGKTTTTYLCFALAEAARVRPAMLTTVEYRIGENSEEAVRTTPEASDTNQFLLEAVNYGCTFAAMEASSQAIDLNRCDWLNFRIAIFTNLTQDHLDYHLTMDNYFDAKKKLFDGRLGYKPKASVINIDDAWGQKLAEELRRSGSRVSTISQDPTGPADLIADNIDVSLLDGTSFTLKSRSGDYKIVSPLVGRPHVYNILTATAAALELGYNMDDVITGIAKCAGAPGRFERVIHDGDFAVVVDYAHTDDALLNTLKTARELTYGRIITVFGCGGDRDKTKRVPMGEVAGANSDLVIITSDNPRTEDPLEIITEIEVGVAATGTEFHSISDRREAIGNAISLAAKNDVVIIAGKGHETYQVVGNEKFHFDDREVARDALNQKSAA
ncbi:MAG: UDP-N-acetylmuramoyl-L-alanyl-D-glutamate--2,6-diaminopimelate ligase [Blastocatellia bacterium]|nr:UDP-N-acetylmuramoyl-L-alanyl-D-glutamate--2,6-diaminopimelate ligase [Blastocatellia bacterium]